MTSWIPLTEHTGYEITEPSDDGAWQIRKLRPDGQYKFINQNMNKKHGYYYVKLDKHMPIHRVICEQFKPNPDNLPVCDHLNRIKTDNRLSNLRWTTQAINCCNRAKIRGAEQEFFDELPPGYVPFTSYTIREGETRQFPDLFIKVDGEESADGIPSFTPSFIAYDSKHQYRRLYPDKSNKNCVVYRDINRRPTSITFSKIKRGQ
jgi:hypothetical protein